MARPVKMTAPRDFVIATNIAPKISRIQNVIFDMDGVIIDSHPAHRKAWQEFLQTLGRSVSEAELDFILDGRKRHEILRHFLGDVPESDLAEYGRKKDHLFQEISLDVKPIAGVLDFIEDLRRCGIALAVATSASKTRTRSTLKRLGLTDRFAVIVTGDDIPNGKPDPSIYHLVCSRLNAEAQECLVLEDAVSAVQAAKRAGFQCVGVGYNGSCDRLRAVGADHVIENFVGLSFENLQARLRKHS